MFRKIFPTLSIILFLSCLPERAIIKQTDINKEIIPEWQKRNEFLKNFKARARIFISTSEDIKEFNAVYIASLPLSFRVEILTPFGQTIAGISSDGRNIYAININDNVCFRAPLDEKNLARFIPFNISPRVLVDFLLTRIPFFENSNITVNSVENGRLEVSVNREEQEEVFFDGRNEFLITGELNDLSFNFERFFKSEEVLIPSRITLKNNTTNLIIEIENPVINSHVEPTDFVLKIPDECILTEWGIF